MANYPGNWVIEVLFLRVISALVGIPLVVIAVLAGGWFFFAAALIVALTGQAEFYTLIFKGGFHSSKALGLLAALLVMSLFFINRMDLLAHILIGLVFALFLQQMTRGNIAGCISNIAGTIMGVLYPVLPLTYLFLLRRIGPFHLLFVFVITWANDTGAYFIGKAVGRRPLSPSLSHKKTREGAVGGLLVSAIAALPFVRILDISPWYLVGIGLLLGCGAQLGDLFASMLKRFAGVKDSGKLIPGHGGVLDRFDALLLALPLGYLLFSLL